MEFSVNKSISLPLGVAQKVADRAEENNRTFSEELTSLVRLALQVITDSQMREEQRTIIEAENIVKKQG